MRLSDERGPNDIPPKSAPHRLAEEPARDSEVVRLMHRVLLAVAALILIFALTVSLWSG